VIENYLKTSPNNGKVWADYILVNTSMERFADAEQAWKASKKPLAKYPDEMIQADLAWAQSLMLQRRPEEALKQAELVLRNDPEAVKALGKKNPSMLEMGLTRTGMLAPANVVKGNSLLALERWDDAAKAYTAAIEEDSGAADVLILRAGAYLEAGEKDKARADVERGLKFLPGDPRGLAILKELGDN
jgi:tetratricopeptide (TPR) repeat protein